MFKWFVQAAIALNLVKLSVLFATSALVLVVARGVGAIGIVVDYALDATNENWFDPFSKEG